jgi:phage terminase large subunit
MNRIDLRITDKVSWLLSKPKRIKIAVGGRGSAKSIGVGDIMLMFADHGERICCSREFQNSIDDSVHESIKQEIDRLDVKGMNVLNNSIKSASNGEIFYKGLARNITSLKTLAGVKRLWIEEGESVSESSLRVLTPSIRSSAAANEKGEEPPEIWITMNRGSSKDAISVKYLARAEKALKETGYYEDDIMMVVEVNWRDNPWFPPELEQERLDDIERLTRAEYDHIWEGAYNDSVDRAIIKPEWFDACIDAHIALGIKPIGAKILAHDPSDEGNDNKGIACRHGIVVEYADDSDQGDVNEGMDWALEKADEIRPDLFIWDGDGMGVALRRQVSEAFDKTRTDYVMFRGSMSPEDPDQPYDGDFKKENKFNQDVFLNRRAQYYIRLRDRVYKTYKAVTGTGYYPPDELISFSSKIDKINLLRAELCRIPTKPNASGFIQILSKKEMAAKGIDSPNIGDSVMMLMVIPISKADTAWTPPKVHKQQRSASRYDGRR